MMEPRLPGQKPVGPVEINWNHPLARGLTGFWLLNHTPVDLVSGQQITLNDAPAQGADENGTYIQVDEDISWIDTGRTASDLGINGANSRTVMLLGKITKNTSSDKGLFSVGTLSSNADWTLEQESWTNTGSYKLGNWGANKGASSFYDSDDVLIAWSAMYDGTSAWFFCNDTKTSVTSLPVNTGDANTLRFGKYGTRTTEIWEGPCYMAAVWDRDLSDAEWTSFRQSPYQFLQPAGTAARLVITTPPPANATAGLRVPDPKWEEPALLQAGLKPTGPVVVDFEHPLAKGLAFCFIMTPSGLVDLVTGTALQKNGDVTYTTRAGVEGYDFDGTLDYFVGAGRESWNLTGPLTLLWHGMREGAALAHFMGKHLVSGASHNPFDFRTNDATGVVRLVRAGSTGSYQYSGGAVLQADKLSVVSVSAPTGNLSDAVSFCVDGDIYASGAGADIDVTSTAADLRIGVRSDEAVSLTGVVVFVVGWGRHFQDSEHAKLNRDPYQFLIPA